MKPSSQPEENTPTGESDTSSVSYFLQRGLELTQEGRFIEGQAFFALAREQLTPKLPDIAAVLDALHQSQTRYLHALQTLHEANKSFVEIDFEHQGHLATLTKLLPTLREEIANTSRAATDSVKNFNRNKLSLYNEGSIALPELYFVCFGRFEVSRNGQPILLCPNRKGQAVLRYLIAQTEHRASLDTLISAVLSEDVIDNAHHKLRVAISAIRCALNKGYESSPGGGYILCNNQVYLLNPTVSIQSDVEEFLALYQAGRQVTGNAMASQYENACQLYTGPFLTEDLYSGWSFIRREQLYRMYLEMCSSLAEYYIEINHCEDSIKWATAILKENPCEEIAHRQLIRAYAVTGRRADAARQFKHCQSVLMEELGVQAMPETVNLFDSVMSNEYPSTTSRK